MKEAEREARARDRAIAQNESGRQAASAVRLSAWALGSALLVVLCGLAVGWMWLHR